VVSASTNFAFLEQHDKLLLQLALAAERSFVPLNDARKAVWQTCLSLFNEWQKYYKKYNDTGSITMKDRANGKLNELKQLLYEQAQFSMVAVTCLLATGNPTIQRFAMAVMSSSQS